MSNQLERSTRIIVHGSTGRMGSRLCDLAHHDDRFTLVAALTRASSPRIGAPSVTSAAQRPSPCTHTAHTTEHADVVIDFSSPEGLTNAIKSAQIAHASLLVGTTGLSPTLIDQLKIEARSRAVLLAPNTSLGVAVIARAVALVARALGPQYDCSIVEAHHNKKKDAPSGTALRLAHAARDSGAALTNENIVAIRGGDVIGEHTVRFAGAGEYVELTHRATSRDLFVRGALTAARWLTGRAPGWYTIEHVLDDA